MHCMWSMENCGTFWCLWKPFFFPPPSTFSLLSQIGQRLNSVGRSFWAAFRGCWHTGDESSCQDRCWGHTSQPQHVCEVSGMVLTSDARLQRTSSIRPPSLSQHTGGKERNLTGLRAGERARQVLPQQTEYLHRWGTAVSIGHNKHKCTDCEPKIKPRVWIWKILHHWQRPGDYSDPNSTKSPWHNLMRERLSGSNPFNVTGKLSQ